MKTSISISSFENGVPYEYLKENEYKDVSVSIYDSEEDLSDQFIKSKLNLKGAKLNVASYETEITSKILKNDN